MPEKRKKILMIHHRLPYPPHSGMDKARFALLWILNQHYHITLAVLSSNKLNIEHIAKVKEHCSELIIIEDNRHSKSKSIVIKKLGTIFWVLKSILLNKPVFLQSIYSKQFETEIKKLQALHDFEIVQPLSDYTLNYAMNLHPKPYLIFGPNDDMAGMSEGILKHTKRGLKKILLKIELRARKSWQEKMILKADISLYFSKDDINHIINRNPSLENKIVWMPGVIEFEDKWNVNSIYSVEKNSIIFTGGLVSEFNKQALIYFFKSIWPLITKCVKDVKLYVVGQTHGTEFQEKYSFPNVYYSGRVESVHPWLEESAIFINPAISGTGIKTKIVEAMRFGKPIVTTKEGTSGIWKISNDAIFVCSDPENFSNQVITLLQNYELRIQSSLNSRKLFEEEYSMNKLEPRIAGLYESILKNVKKVSQ
jgi:glycosyltransferase involved in cell wall biosynthesis